MTAHEPSSPEPSAGDRSPADPSPAARPPATPNPPAARPASAGDLALAAAIAAVEAATPGYQPTDPPGDDDAWRRRRVVPPTPGDQPRPAGRLISLAGGDVPALLKTEEPIAAAPAPPQPQAPPAPATAPPVPQPPAAAPRAAEPPAAPEPSSLAPPGFTGAELRIAESQSLVALDDPSPADDTDDPAPAAGDSAGGHVAGSAILTLLMRGVPRRGDRQRFGADAGSTTRISLSVIVGSLLVLLVGPPVARLLERIPLLGRIVDQLDTLTAYPSAYGLRWAGTVVVVLVLTRLVMAQVEYRAARDGTQGSPVSRLNVALASLLVLAAAGGLLTTLSSDGTVAAISATCFFLALCLLIPIGNTPGAQALGHQPARAWALITVLAFVALIWSPTLPVFLITLLGFTQVRTNWQAVSRGDDPHRDGPIDTGNRLSAIAIVVFVLIAGVVGLHAMTLPADQVRGKDHATPPSLAIPELEGQELPQP